MSTSSSSARPFALLALATLAAHGDAFAQTRICEQTVAEWEAGIDRIGAALEAGDIREARIQFELVDDDWGCLVMPAPAGPLGEYAQYKALMAWQALDPEATLRWARAAEYVAPNHPWPDWVDASHPIRRMVAIEGPAEVVILSDRFLAHPKGGGVFLDGGFVLHPVMPKQTPVLVQVFDGDGAKIEAFWTDGPYVPERWLTDDPDMARARPPRWWIPGGGASVAVAPSPVEALPYEEPSSLIEAAPQGEPLPTDLEPRRWPSTRRNLAIGAAGAALAGGGLCIASGVLASGAREAAADPSLPYAKAEQMATGANATGALGIVGLAAATGLATVVIAW